MSLLLYEGSLTPEVAYGHSVTLEIAFDEVVAGVFSLNSGLDGPDVLSDVGVFSGTFDDVTADVRNDDIVVQMGADALAGTVQVGNLTVTVARVDNPGFWNPNNPLSPLNAVTPGFVPMRPAKLTETVGGIPYDAFYGFLRRAKWQSSTRSCQLYFEDILFRADRVFPVITSTGPTTTGAAFNAVLDAIGWPAGPGWRNIAEGDPLDDFSANGGISARQIFANLVETERGTVFMRGLVFTYESRGIAETRAPSATISTATNIEELESGIDADSIFTRVTVTKTAPADGSVIGTWQSVNAVAEHEYGESEAQAISSPYVPASAGQVLADDVVYAGVNGKPPVTAIVAAAEGDAATLQTILQSPLQTVFAINDPLGGTQGNYVLQGVTHTISTGIRRAQYVLTRRFSTPYTIDSPLDGSDGSVFRY